MSAPIETPPPLTAYVGVAKEMLRKNIAPRDRLQ